MNTIFLIVSKHYTKLRRHLREKMVRLYFELFILGITEEAFREEDYTMVITPIAENFGTDLSAVMLDTLVQVIRQQRNQTVKILCGEILNLCIAVLFQKHKFHQFQHNPPTNRDNCYPKPYSQHTHLSLVKYLL
jgi:hypothetical protein